MRSCLLNTMPSLSLAIPETFPDSSQNVDVSFPKKKENWFDAGFFYNRIIFEPWADFDEQVFKSKYFCQQLPSVKLSILSEELQLVTDIVNEKDIMEEFELRDYLFSKIFSVTSLVAEHHPEFLGKNCQFRADSKLSTEVVLDQLPQTARRELQIETPVQVYADYGFYTSSISDISIEAVEKNNHSPMAIAEVLGPSAHIIPPFLSHIDLNEASSIVSFFQKQLTKEKHELLQLETQEGRKRSKTDRRMIYMARLAKAITQAIHTTSGCGILSCYNQTLFFYVDKLISKTLDEHGENQRILVRLSKIYKPSDENGIVAAIIAWIINVEQLNKAGHSRLETMINIIRHIVPIKELRSISSHLPVTKDDNLEIFSTHHPILAEHNPRERCFNESILDPYFDIVYSRFLQVKEKEFWKVIRNHYEDMTSLVDSFRDDEKVIQAFNNRYELLPCGKGKIVMRTGVEGVEGVLKYGDYRKERENLIVEAVVYCRLTSSGLLGAVVPRLLAFGLHFWVGTIVITESVGHEIVQTEHGFLIVESTFVSSEELYELEVEVLSSLRKLHQAGVLHGDISLQNLRAKRCKTEFGTTWKIWWIDMGSAIFDTDWELQNAEERQVHELFKHAYLVEM